MTIKTVVGRLGAVPEVRVTEGGRQVVNFRVAETKRKFDRDRNEWVDDFTIWHQCESWRNTNALAQIPTGTLVIVVGEERDASYERDGRTVQRVVVRASDVGELVLDAKRPAEQVSEQPWSTPTADDSWGGQW